MTARKPSNQRLLFQRVLREARPCWPHLLGFVALSLLSTPLSLLAPLPLKVAVDSIIGTEPLPHPLNRLIPSSLDAASGALAFVAILGIAIALLKQLQGGASSLLQTYIGERLLLNFRAKLFRHVQRLSLFYHDSRGTTDSTYRIQYDAYCVQAVTMGGVIPFVNAGITLVGMVAVTALVDWQLALVALTVAPILFSIARGFRRPLRNRWKEIKHVDSSAMSVIQEVLGAVRVVKAFGREDHEHDRFVRQSRKKVSRLMQAALFQGSFEILVGVTMAAGTSAALWIGVLHVRSGALTLGELLVVMAYLAQLYSPLNTLSKLVTDLQSAFASAERAFALIDEIPDVVERPGARALVRARGHVTFKNLFFSYDGTTPVLRGISVDVPAGTRVGISGATGAGKTTLTNLLMRFYDPTAGQILLDGEDLRDYRLTDLRDQFALVLQDSVLFSTSIAENIAYACPGASEEQIVEAARLANAHDFISRLPDGYQTLVGERGMRLSGGERQRISLARAFLKDAPILLLDEPTSAVDVKTEAGIMEAVKRLERGRTTFMIAHRLSTLDNCDLRLELESGELVTSQSA